VSSRARLSVHLVRRLPCFPLPDAAVADIEAGFQPRIVAIHDAVLQPLSVQLNVDVLAITVVADDCRRRGIPVPDGALEYAELVDLIATAERVVSW
jgi:hypothetical protein